MTQKYREKCLAQKINVCNACGTTENLVVHHIDGDRSNNVLDNLIPVCKSCHQNIHMKKNPPGVIGDLQDKLPDDCIGHKPGTGHTHQGYSQIRVTENQRRVLHNEKEPGESYADVLLRKYGVGESE